MNSYIINFAVYSFAMVGFLLTLVFVYKKSVNQNGILNKKNFLKVENTLKLSPVKTIYVLKAGNERFLIAGDSANTTMLAKLNNDNNEETLQSKEKETKTVKEYAVLSEIK